MRFKPVYASLGFVGLLVLLAVGYVVYVVVDEALHQPGATLDFRQHHGQLEMIVGKVKEMGLKPGESIELRTNEGMDPASMAKYGPEEREANGRKYVANDAGHVWARCDQAGRYTIVVEVHDQGRGGEYGYAFSDDPNVLTHESSKNRLDVPGDLYMPGSLRNEHWRAVYRFDIESS